MGKAIIVPNVDWSNNNLGQVTASVLVISGSSSVTLTGTFSAILAGNPVIATWSISDNSVASLSSNIGDTITITALTNGTATLYATYNEETAELLISCNAGYITEDDIVQSMLHYYASNNMGSNSRTSVVLPDITNTSTFHGTMKNNSATIKIGVQIWDENQVLPSSDSSSPSPGTTPKPAGTCWDSGWITQGNTATFNSSCNKNNSVGSAQSSNSPKRVNLACTYVNGGTGMPTIEEIKAAIELIYYPE